VQKITEIKESYTVKRREKVNGEEKFVEKTFTRFKEVRVVEGLPRFGHFLLDRVFFYLFGLLIGVFLGLLVGLTGIEVDFESSEMKIYDSLFSWLILQPLFYFIFEASMQASPAKAILGRIVVDEYGNKPTMKQIFIRSISRSVPFEAFSCLGSRGWHDTWSDTFVIRKKDLEELRMLQKIDNIGASPEAGKEQKNDSDR
jgi:uncharacterized RDD family membrane protein YckC